MGKSWSLQESQESYQPHYRFIWILYNQLTGGRPCCPSKSYFLHIETQIRSIANPLLRASYQLLTPSFGGASFCQNFEAKKELNWSLLGHAYRACNYHSEVSQFLRIDAENFKLWPDHLDVVFEPSDCQPSSKFSIFLPLTFCLCLLSSNQSSNSVLPFFRLLLGLLWLRYRKAMFPSNNWFLR